MNRLKIMSFVIIAIGSIDAMDTNDNNGQDRQAIKLVQSAQSDFWGPKTIWMVRSFEKKHVLVNLQKYTSNK